MRICVAWNLWMCNILTRVNFFDTMLNKGVPCLEAKALISAPYICLILSSLHLLTPTPLLSFMHAALLSLYINYYVYGRYIYMCVCVCVYLYVSMRSIMA